MLHVVKFNIVQINQNRTCQHTTPIMRTLSAELTNHIFSLLELGYSAHNISSSTGFHHKTIIRLHSKHFPDLHKSSGGCPHKLSPTDICHATHLFGSGKAENAGQLKKHFRMSRTYLYLHKQSGIT